MHTDGDGLQGFDALRRRIAAPGDLGLQFPVTGGVDIGERRTGRDDALRIRDAFGGAEDFQELIALAPDASEEAHFLENEGPRDQGKEKENAQNGASNPAGLRKNFKDVADEIGEEQMNNVRPSGKENNRDKFTVTHARKEGQRNGEWCVVSRGREFTGRLDGGATRPLGLGIEGGFGQVFPGDKDEVLVFEEFLEFGVLDEVGIVLTPLSTPVRMIERRALDFGVIMSEVNDELIGAGREGLQHFLVGVEPFGLRNPGMHLKDAVEDEGIGREGG